MKNCIILGAGRSGTSMVAGCFANSGYFMGNYPLDTVDITNPKGFFEDRLVNELNEKILFPVVPKRPPLIGDIFFRHIPKSSQLWLSALGTNLDFKIDNEIQNQIESLIKNTPFCFKDPRFSYTLPAWQPFLKNTVYICVFRDPVSTSKSILKQSQNRAYLKSLSVSYEQCLKMWESIYRSIINQYSPNQQWMFIHYNQVLTDYGVSRLENFTGAMVDRTFPDSKLRHQFFEDNIPDTSRATYSQLCQLADYTS